MITPFSNIDTDDPGPDAEIVVSPFSLADATLELRGTLSDGRAVVWRAHGLRFDGRNGAAIVRTDTFCGIRAPQMVYRSDSTYRLVMDVELLPNDAGEVLNVRLGHD